MNSAATNPTLKAATVTATLLPTPSLAPSEVNDVVPFVAATPVAAAGGPGTPALPVPDAVNPESLNPLANR
jgi:hypothetical protein